VDGHRQCLEMMSLLFEAAGIAARLPTLLA
jgi:hypothetical protein